MEKKKNEEIKEKKKTKQKESKMSNKHLYF